MSLVLEGRFYDTAATAGTAVACILASLPLLSPCCRLLLPRGLSSNNCSIRSKPSAAPSTSEFRTAPTTLAYRIILMVPVYALTSLLAFLFCSPQGSLQHAGARPLELASDSTTNASVFPGGRIPGRAAAAAAAAATALKQGSGGWRGLWLRGAREAYEVYALYTFLELMIALLGGEQQAVNQLHLKGTLQHVWPFNHVLPPMECDRAWLGHIKRLAAQFVFVKPAAFVLSACMQQEGFFFVALISNISAAVAMYALILFYMAVRRPLAPWRPLPKFLWLKAVVFVCFWQSLGLRWLAGLFIPGNREAAAAAAARLQDWLICLEMVPCAAAHLWAFPAREFAALGCPGGSPRLEGRHAAEDECSVLLQAANFAAASASTRADTPGADARGRCAFDGTPDDTGNGSVLKKPLHQLITSVHQLLMSDAVLSDATHAVFGPQQQQREFHLEPRSSTGISGGQ
ncbi:protein LAZ1 [Cyclospora cayetanensis]|uniref:Protein LAZ1 n=1 Tax=Cyclospora cayetanensis TaxID=88456 RepID=A0A6P6RZE7_9EIME|nr:protein LAZ1 [Cyclospora cayetanensis]